VTESFEKLRDLPLYLRLSDRWLMRVKDGAADLENNMRARLAALKVVAEEDKTQGALGAVTAGSCVGGLAGVVPCPVWSRGGTRHGLGLYL
jgi:NCAIR mutase (PurE)-related protein